MLPYDFILAHLIASSIAVSSALLFVALPISGPNRAVVPYIPGFKSNDIPYPPRPMC